MTKLLIASNNPGKLAEFEALLHGVSGLEQVELVLPRQIGLALDVLEDGETYAENAARKAQAYYRAAHRERGDRDGEPLAILADDSGLEVDCLGGAPGLHSARYSDLVSTSDNRRGAPDPPSGAPQPGAVREARPVGGDADRRALLLRNLAGQPRPWLAHFHCTVALISPEGEMVYTNADCPGEIIPSERGSGGFGYDAIFLLPGLGLTMAELSMEQKNQLSHRALAVKAAIPVLRGWFG